MNHLFISILRALTLRTLALQTVLPALLLVLSLNVAWAEESAELADQAESAQAVVEPVEATEAADEASDNPDELSEDEQYWQWAREVWENLERQTGVIQLPGDVANLTVPEDFYYLNPEDTYTVLVDVWGNPPGAAEGTLGMMFPAESTPFDGDAWGVTIEYEEDGYVSDEDADSIDYAEMLSSMQKDTRDSSEERIKQGYESIELVGWAAQPHYDKANHKLYWAKELKFGDDPNHTLNYDIRVLGRKGVLVLSFIAGIEQLETINNNAEAVMAMAEFKQGARYEDFVDGDKVAAYGIGALVAGKVMAKTGILAAVLLFLKKFGVVIAVGIVALFAKIFRKS